VQPVLSGENEAPVATSEDILSVPTVETGQLDVDYRGKRVS
jgi:hypothetical protein